MSLKVPPEKIRKRKSEDELGKDHEDPEETARQEIRREIQERQLKKRLERTDGKGYVEKPIRKRKRSWCCACQDECAVEADEEGLKCHKCGHVRCPRCFLGKLKNVWGQ